MSLLRFTRDHEWVRLDGDLAVVGITDYAQSQLGDVVYVELPEIGRQFGGKHHTTVLHSVEKIEELRKNDKDLNRLINKLTEQLGG